MCLFINTIMKYYITLLCCQHRDDDITSYSFSLASSSTESDIYYVSDKDV